MQARDIKGYNNRIYTLEELKKIPQHKHPFGVPEGANTFYYQNMTKENLEGEQFRPYPNDELIEVSNYGRVRINNEIIKQIDNFDEHPNGGYLWLDCPKYPQYHHNKLYYVYILVVDTWLGKNPGTPGNWYHRHHINNNGYDNRPENLIWLTSEEHKQIPYPNY